MMKGAVEVQLTPGMASTEETLHPSSSSSSFVRKDISKSQSSSASSSKATATTSSRTRNGGVMKKERSQKKNGFLSFGQVPSTSSSSLRKRTATTTSASTIESVGTSDISSASSTDAAHEDVEEAGEGEYEAPASPVLPSTIRQHRQQQQQQHQASRHNDSSDRPSTPPRTSRSVAVGEFTPPPRSSSSNRSNQDRVGSGSGVSMMVHEGPGETSPSSICGRRKMSAAVVTTNTVRHDMIPHGRPKIVVSQQQQQQQRQQQSSPGKKRASNTSARRNQPPSMPNVDEDNASISDNDARSRSDLPSVTTTAASTRLQQQQQREDRRAAFALRRSYSCPETDGPGGSANGVLLDENHKPTWMCHPEPLRFSAWSEAPSTEFKVRATNYSQRRLKTNSESSVFRLWAHDMIRTPQPVYGGMCAHPHERIQRALHRETVTQQRELPAFIFCVNFIMPYTDCYYHSVSYFGVDDLSLVRTQTNGTAATPIQRLCEQFLFGGSDQFRNERFKLIPRIVEGNFVVRKAVGTKPALLGTKLKQLYIQSDRYFELLVDIASDPVAQSVVKLALGYAKSIVVDMMYLIEGKDDDAELPERILGGVRLNNVDIKQWSRPIAASSTTK